MSDPNTLTIWQESFSRELGRLSQGYQHIQGTNTIRFTSYQSIPLSSRRNITYGNIVVSYKPHKSDPHRSRLTAGGDRIKYNGQIYTPAVDLTIFKLVHFLFQEFHPVIDLLHAFALV